MLIRTKNSPKIGDVRVKAKFALFPIIVRNTLNGNYYFCWLEHYYSKEEYKEIVSREEYGVIDSSTYWVEIDKWI